MKKSKSLFLLLFFMILISCSSNDTSNNPDMLDEFIRAADLSFLPEIESEGTIYKHNEIAQDALITLKNAGCNTIRIRLWKDPINEHSGLTEVKTLAQRVKQAGMKVWLTVHYSDTWADPGNQTKPVAWENLSFSNLKTEVENYTALVLTEIQPDIIQIGNETNDGMLWPSGRLSTNEAQYLVLVETASTTIRNQSPSTKIMLHFAGITGSDWFFNKVASIDYDYIGLSYYPIYHGKSLVALQNTMNSLGQLYNKKVIIAETSYPFTLGFNDYTNNIVGLQDQLIPSFQATILGQKNYLSTLKNTIIQSTNGFGFCYWGAEWIAFRGPTALNGSSWENQALWDFNNNSLPVMDVFSKD